MNNLTTRRIVLGLLMALVLALGAQGIAEAVLDPELSQSSSEFFKFRTPNETFSISLRLSFDTVNTTETITVNFDTGITPIEKFFDESGIVTLREVGGTETGNGSKFSVGSTGNEVSTSFSIKGRFKSGTAGPKTVKISSTTPSWTYTYTYFVSSATGAITDSIDFAGLTNFGTGPSGYAEGDFGDAPIQIYADDSSKNLPVLYSNRSKLLMSHTTFGDERVSLPSSGPISSAFTIHLKANTSTDVVTAQVRGSDVIRTGVYIYGFPTLEVDAPTGRETGSEDSPGKPGEVIRNAFTATVKDGNNAAVPGVPVHFNNRTDGTGTLVFGSDNTGTLVQVNNDLVTSNGNQVTAGSHDENLYVRTNSSGKASVNFRLGDGDIVTVIAVGKGSEKFEVYAGSDAGLQLSELRIQSVSGSLNTFNLYAIVEVDGDPATPGLKSDRLGTHKYDVRFTTDDGELTSTPTDNSLHADDRDSQVAATVWERPNTSSIAQVAFVSDGGSNPEVTASLFEPIGGVQTITETVTFNITGSSNDPPLSTTTARLSIRVDGTGTTRAVTVTATNAQGVNIPGLRVALTGTALTTSRVVNTGTATVITLPTTPDDYTITATFSGYDPDTETLTVAASAALGTFSITTIDAPVNGQQTIEVTVLNANGARASVPVTVTLVGPGISRTVETTRGTGRAIITIPTTTTSYTLTVSADGYTRKQETFTTTGQRAEAPAPPSGPAGEADSVEIDGSRTTQRHGERGTRCTAACASRRCERQRC